jgi:hypothetical protein
MKRILAAISLSLLLLASLAGGATPTAGGKVFQHPTAGGKVFVSPHGGKVF